MQGHSELRVREQLIHEGELDFEREVHGLDSVIVCPVPRIADQGEQAMFTYIAKAEHWLAQNIRSRYVAFPTTACGRHKDGCFNVYFADHRAAMLFKISFL